MYFKNSNGATVNFKVEHPVIERPSYGHRGRTSRSYWVVYNRDGEDGVEKWRIPATMDNFDILLGYCAAIKEPVLFGSAFLPYRERIEATIDNAQFIS